MMPSETSAPRQRILVIDDDFDIREVLRDRHNAMTESASKIIRNRLQALGFDVVAASSGHHGVALIEDHASKGCQIDGILLNWKMPGSDYSMAALQKIQEEHAEIPLIVMAALSQIDRLDWFEDMMRKGARDCILKPLDTDLLWEKCSRHFMPLSRIPLELKEEIYREVTDRTQVESYSLSIEI